MSRADDSSGAARGRVATAEYLGAAAIVGITTAIGFALRSRLSTIDVAMLFLLAVVVSATRYRRGAALFASILGIAAFDFVFVPPYYTFDVRDVAYTLTFAMMLLVAVVMSQLTGRIREQGRESMLRERRTTALLELDRALRECTSLEELTRAIAGHVGRAGRGEAAVVLVDRDEMEDGAPLWPANELFETVEVRVAATWAYRHGEPAGAGTHHCAEAEAVLFPLRTAEGSLGVVALRPEPPGTSLGEEEYQTVAALGEQAAAAIERMTLAERSEAARAEAEAERLRTSLLSSLSHDLRTPLATIEGAASALLQQGEALPLDVRQDMVQSVLEESRRMTRLVSNLLDMVRVETGALAVRKAWQPLEEALGVALLRLDEPLRNHPVHIRLPADLPLVPIDELLIEQVFINLLENAIKHTPAETPIIISAWREDGAVAVEVADEGPGVAPGSEQAVFRKFYRGAGRVEGGAGLGLTICLGIVTAHGGRIWAEQRSGKGAAFRFTLPLEGPVVRGVPVEADD